MTKKNFFFQGSVSRKIFDPYVSFRPGRMTANQHIFKSGLVVPLLPTEAAVRRYSTKIKVFLKHPAKLAGKHLCWRLFLMKFQISSLLLN